MLKGNRVQKLDVDITVSENKIDRTDNMGTIVLPDRDVCTGCLTNAGDGKIPLF